jgi:hypothetical protein
MEVTMKHARFIVLCAAFLGSLAATIYATLSPTASGDAAFGLGVLTLIIGGAISNEWGGC